MPSFCPLGPVAEAVYGVLVLDPGLMTLAPGGVFGDVPQDPTYPFVWFEVMEDQQHGGFGTKPGRSALPEIDLRIHVFQGDNGTMRDAEAVMARAIELLADPPTVAGYASCAIFHDQTIPLPDEELNGVKVKELVARFRLYVEEDGTNASSWIQPGWFQT
jgi:hypothetical protein